MNRNYDLELTCNATFREFETSFTFDPYNDCTDIDGLKELALVEFESELEAEDKDGMEVNDIKVSIDFSGANIPEGYDNDKDIWELAEAFAECDYSIEVIVAALKAGISASDIYDSYQGEYSSDEDFAENLAEEMGMMNKNDAWPYSCIDWELAAKELMMDYVESNGHYFRQ